MKIERIDLKAYGHFTNQSLVFTDAANFHIICGPNEAGKTTLWRAINGALFGIPERTQDVFLHDTKKLRVGLSLTSKSGERLSVMRRKGRVNTLLKYDPQSGQELAENVPEDALHALLGGLSQELFLAMYSLDHDALMRGGESLAQGKGDAGESLFEAGAGLNSIRNLRTKLDREAETLFKPRATTSLIYRAISAYDVARRQAKDASIRPAEWNSAKLAMEAASDEYEGAKERQARLQKEVRRLERLAAILPDVAALEHAQHRLVELADVPILPPSAAAERVAAVTKRNEAIDAEQDATQRLENRLSELASMQLNESLLADAEAIEAIHHATNAYREALVQFAKAESDIEDAQSTYDALLKQIAGDEKPEKLPQWLPDPTRMAKIRALISAGATFKATHQACRRALADKKLEIEQLNAEIQSLGEEDISRDLQAYLDSIADVGDPELRVKQLQDEATLLETKLNAEALALKMTSAEDIAKTTVPLDAEALSFKTDNEELRRRAHSIRESIENIEDDLAALQAEIKGLEVRGDVPTREEVSGEREKRDALWLGIRRYFMPIQGEPVPAPPPSADGYEHAVFSADNAADGLFSDAERATRYAEARVRESQMQHALELAKGRAESVKSKQEQLNLRWIELLKTHNLPSLNLIEADQWILKREAFMNGFASVQNKRQEAQQANLLTQDIRARVSGIYKSMGLQEPSPAERLTEVLSRARAIAKQYAERATERQLKTTQRSVAAAALKHAEVQESDSLGLLETWLTQWAEAMSTIHLAKDASEEEATARLEQFAEFKKVNDSLDRLKSLLRDAKLRIDDYQSSLETVWKRIYKHELPQDGRGHDVLASELYREMSATRAQQEKKNTLIEQIADDQIAVQRAQLAAHAASEIIDKLMLQAGCGSIESLELIEGKSAQRAGLETEVRDIEARLVKSSSLPLAEALKQAVGQDPDAIAITLEQYLQNIDQGTAQVQKLHEAYLSARQAFEKMDGSALAAEAQQKTAQHAAQIADLGADYAASRIASAVLAQVIDAYQKRNQGPLIERTSKRFAAITGGRYAGVVIDYDEDRQILKAVRADGERLSMEQLSTGRRDQLFLSLRLAAIEGHLENGEPLPVIVDDILIQFDDEAAAATFKLLADLSQRTQVLFLTHHEHLLNVAQSAIGNTAFRQYQL